MVALLAPGCDPGAPPAEVEASPAVSEIAQVVPGPGLPAAAVVQPANNNLDVIVHGGQVFLAWRTAPTHFASAETEMHVVRATGEGWAFETSIRLGTDVREPRFLSAGDDLLLYFAVLGADAADFEPQGTMRVERGKDGGWTAPEWAWADGFIAWRMRWHEGRAYLSGYTGGGEIYDAEGAPAIETWFLASADGRTWAPVAGDGPVRTGGGSETDWAWLDDGSIVAVARNEAGDELGWGSHVCRADAADLGAWECVADPRKFDSPLVFVEAGRTWLLARRNLSEDGAYDLGMRELSHAEQTLRYQVEYWATPKRCALWEVDPSSLQVRFVLDLPSRGDTCFPSALRESDHGGGGRWRVYNYSSPIDGEDLSWLAGQQEETRVYSLALDIPG